MDFKCLRNETNDLEDNLRILIFKLLKFFTSQTDWMIMSRPQAPGYDNGGGGYPPPGPGYNNGGGGYPPPGPGYPPVAGGAPYPPMEQQPGSQMMQPLMTQQVRFFAS